MKVPELTRGDLSDYHWLTSDAAVPFLMRCAQHSGELTRLVTSLRKELSAERTHLVIEQAELRHRAKEKFSCAGEMFFTRKGLEQATDQFIAAYKGNRAAAIRQPMIDICCGIGGDLIAFELAGNRQEAVSGVDLDPVVAHLASENFRRITGKKPLVQVRDAADVDLPAGGWHVDPDRRAEGQRRTQLEGLVPDLETIERWRAQRRSGAIKLAPATQIPESWEQAAEREWIGSRGECRQQMIWFGDWNKPSHAGQRCATVIAPRGNRTVYERPGSELPSTTQVGRFVYEPDAAVLAARLSSSLAAEHGLQALTSDGGYLTGDTLVRDAAMQVFETQDVFPYNIRHLKWLFLERNVGTLEIKKRGVDDTPERIRNRLSLQGGEQATLLVARLDQSTVVAIIAQRVESIHHAPP